MNEISVIDFESYFTRDLLVWAEEHKDISSDEDKFKEIIPDIYSQWINEPKEYLNGISAMEYFKSLGDPQAYLTMLIEYAKLDIEPPDPLIDCIVDNIENAYPYMVNILSAVPTDDITEEQLCSVKARIIELITESGCDHMPKLYTALMESLSEDCDLGDAISEALAYLGEDIADIVFNAYETSDNEYAKMCYLDIMSEYRGNEQAAAYVAERISRDEENTAFLASCLGKIGCESSLPYLKNILDDSFIDYFCYSAVKNAIEEIEGIELTEKDFSGDELYELLKTEE